MSEPHLQQSASQQNLKDMVQENLQNQPDTTFLDLQDQEIEDLNVIMDMLPQFEFLEELICCTNLRLYFRQMLQVYHTFRFLKGLL